MNISNCNWKVSWNHRRYNGQKLMDDFRNGSHTGFIKQSKGLAKMCNLPKMGDNVYVSWKKTKVMKCTVVADFVVNEIEMNDEYHIGSTHTQLHTKNNTFLMLKIEEVYETPERMLGNQRTWVKMV